MKNKILLTITFLLLVSLAYGNDQKNITLASNDSKEIFLYEAKKFGLPILRASISIEHKLLKNERPLYQIQADIKSLPSLSFIFRMENHFTSLMDGETLFPLRYIKEIDQEGLLIKKKNYHQTITFDYINRKLVIEKIGNGREEIHLFPETYDPLSIFARYYLKNDLLQEQNINISVFDGIKLKHMVFHSKRGWIKTKMLGEVEAICLESTTSFSSFGEKAGKIRIWYTTVGEKVPVLIKLDLPVGDVKFELKEVKKVRNNGSKEEGKEEI